MANEVDNMIGENFRINGKMENAISLCFVCCVLRNVSGMGYLWS